MVRTSKFVDGKIRTGTSRLGHLWAGQWTFRIHKMSWIPCLVSQSPLLRTVTWALLVRWCSPCSDFDVMHVLDTGNCRHYTEVNANFKYKKRKCEREGIVTAVKCKASHSLNVITRSMWMDNFLFQALHPQRNSLQNMRRNVGPRAKCKVKTLMSRITWSCITRASAWLYVVHIW
jgi:hypothetical protein